MGFIYAISFDGSDRVYIGSTINPKNRLKAHISRLRAGIHHSVAMQRAYDKHGHDAMRFSLIEEVENHNLIEAEQSHLDANWHRRLNATKIAKSRLGMRSSEATKRKISQSLKGNSYRSGIPHDQETKAKISESMRRACAEGRKATVVRPENLAAFNAKVASGERPHPSRNPERDAQIVARHWATKSLKATAQEFGITPSAVWHVVKRCAPSQIRKWERKQ